jgi:hypothetical protein
MSKRSPGKFERSARDLYATPFKAVVPLIPHLGDLKRFAEPCVGEGDLVRHVEAIGLQCAYRGDISTGQDARTADSFGDIDGIITNPPYIDEHLHPMIVNLQRVAPTWLLLPADRAFNQNFALFMPRCSHVVAVGRIKWFPGTKSHSTENFAWYRFDARHRGDTIIRERDYLGFLGLGTKDIMKEMV